MKLQKLLEGDNRILILSGEGENGTFEEYNGKRTMLAIKSRLRKERCNGDRWARAYIYLYTNDLGDVYKDIEDGELRHINLDDDEEDD